MPIRNAEPTITPNGTIKFNETMRRFTKLKNSVSIILYAIIVFIASVAFGSILDGKEERITAIIKRDNMSNMDTLNSDEIKKAVS